MKRIYVTLLTVLLLIFFGANDANAAFKGFIADCLGATIDYHTATLTIKSDGKIKPVGDKDTYIFVCITGGGLNGTKCTTGNAATDTKVFGKTADLEALQAITKSPPCSGGGEDCTVGGVQSPGSNPTKTNIGGTAFVTAIKWKDVYNPTVLHQFSWLQEAAIIDPGDTDITGLGSQQQGTFDFTKLTGDTSKCAKIGWDPRGYVFDAATLNPIKNISIMLSKGPAGGVFTDIPSGLGITNPDITESSNGQYSFYVEPGFYKLRIYSSNATIAGLTTVNPEYQNLFLSEAGKTNVYQKDQEVQELKGMVAIAHIPAVVTDPNLLITSLQKLEEGSSESNGQINIFGRVSHPKSKMIITMNLLDDEGLPVNLVKTDTTDDLGEYDKFINQEQTDAGGKKLLLQNLNVSFELNPFYTTGIFSRSENEVIKLAVKIWNYFSSKIMVSAATNTSYNVKPIPTYIEGIAYDTSGKAIPGAIIGVYVSFSNNPMYMTVADQEGRYKIGSQHLPSFAYELRYKKPTGEIVIVDTGTFIKQNIKFFATAGINPYSEKNTTLAEDKKVQDFFSNTNTTTNLNPTEAGQKNSSNNKYTSGGASGSRDLGSSTQAQVGGGILGAGMQGIVMIVVVIVMLIMIGVGAFIVMKSKQQQMPPQI